MVFAVLDYLQLLNLDWGSNLNNEQFFDDLILENIWNSLCLGVIQEKPTIYITTIDRETFIMDPNSPLKNLFTSQINPC